MPVARDLFARVNRLLDADAAPEQAGARLGDRVAAQIRREVLAPAAEALPGAAPLIEKITHCAGCAATQRGLNGGGLLPGEQAPPVL